MGSRLHDHHGVGRLLDDLERLSLDKESADIVFIVGRDEETIFAHRLILMARCKIFQTPKRGEVCRVAGCTVPPPVPGVVTPIRLPHTTTETFRQFISYIYTGKILLQENGVFEMLALAQELGVDELRHACEEHVISTLSVQSACNFLTSLMELQERSRGGIMFSTFIDRCISFIGENALECVKTNSFLGLKKEALIKIISSDYLSIEEEDVWRAVLNWAKYQAGVTQPTAHWTEEERSRVCQHLAHVIGHVRLLLIDSQVFAEEVEPTGAVPMELSLERYRQAALPSKFADDDRRIKPRISPHLFPGSQILSADRSHFQRVLNTFYGNAKQTWRLVFRASTHGFSAAAFHRHCDGIGPTYTVVLGSKGEICGGFSDVAWQKPNGKTHFLPTDKSFLFTLVNTVDVPPSKFEVVKRPYAICYHSESGPIFGAGADLSIANNCNTNTDSYSNFPHSYNGDGVPQNTLMSTYNFAVADYEVFAPHTTPPTSAPTQRHLKQHY